LFSEFALEGCQSSSDKSGCPGIELVNPVPGDKQACAIWLHREAENICNDAWVTYWMKQGMPQAWVEFWRQHNWSCDTAERTSGLRKFIDKEGFLTTPAPDSAWVHHE